MSTSTKSLVSQVETLDIGESHVRLERLPIEDAGEDEIKEVLAKVRNSQNQITNRLRKAGKGDFKVESVSMLAPDRASIFCMAVTTRVDGDEEEVDI